jgi:2-keto-4-pentenoate hydratase/2-oxohepta-3-ene-1,7-dioic acid hydratase in catechol pathway
LCADCLYLKKQSTVKLIRFGEPGAEKPGVWWHTHDILDVSAFVKDYDEAFFADNGILKLSVWLMTHAEKCPVIPAGTRLGPCIARPSKIICIGLNYAKHAAEGGMEVPKEPVIFFKSTTAICGPNDNLVLPRGSEKTDWEVELALVIGKRASYVGYENAMDHIAGYCLHNDYSERSFQLERGGQWVKGKSADTFAPLGPWLVARDEVPDPHKLRLWLTVNGKMMQDSTTADFIFNIPHIVSYVSQFMTLLPGDVISTGTPQGVGLGIKPQPIYLKKGDVVELGIDGLGTQRQEVV